MEWQTQVEQAVLAASKTLEKKVGYHISFTRQDEDGETRQYGWPDTTGYGEREYNYLAQRLATTDNLYLKSQYGFFLYLRDQRKRQEEVAELVAIFFQLGQQYFRRIPDDTARKHYVLHAVQTLVLAFKLAISRRGHPQTAELLRAIAGFILKTQLDWDPYQPGTLVLFATFTELLTEHPQPFQEASDLSNFLNKNREAVVALGTSYQYGAMELAQATAALATRLKLDARPWQLFTAEQYEHLATEAATQGNSAATVFMDHALRLYSTWREPVAEARVQQQYQQLRTQFPLGTVRTPYPEEGARAIAASIAADVARCSEAELITLIAATPMFDSVRAVEENVKMREKSFTDILPITVQDKYGNAIQLFNTPAEIARFQVLSSYGLSGQIATQTLVRLMLAAYKADKLTAAGIMQHLEASWLGQSRPMSSNGRSYQTYPLRLLASGIRVLFTELDRWRAGETEEPDFVAATDSLTLKIEYILRYICDKITIVTFRPNPKKAGVVMEKLLDELLRDLEEHLDPDDLFFIKYYLHEKAGENLRNRVAHGLLDDGEYGVENVFLVLTMILKLANYEFKPLSL
ncbi:hypothetical protein GCM10027422_49250 [Hymenobacter arcticus]